MASKLAKSIKRPSIKSAFEKNRVSVQSSNHGDKVRERKEISDVIELLQDHDKLHQWQSNLREYSSSQTKLNQPPQVAQEYDEIMNMKKTTRNTPVGHRNFINGIHTTDTIKVP